MPIKVRSRIALFVLFFLGSSAYCESKLRIIALTPALAEMVASLIGPPYSEIAGVTEYTDFPVEISKKPSIGPYPKINLERLMALSPTLIFATQEGNSKDQIDWIRKKGIEVKIFDPKTTQDIISTLLAMGEELGKQQRAKSLALEFEKEVGKLKATVAQSTFPEKSKVFYQLDQNPLISVGGTAFVSMILAEFGFGNIFSDLENPYPRVSKEEVIKRNPDWIVILGSGAKDKASKNMAKSWSGYSSLRAHQLNQVVIANSQELTRPSLRVLTGVESLVKITSKKP